jgi:hypothetical protein
LDLKHLLKRGALLAAANWQTVVIQFVAETTFQVLLAVPIVGAACSSPSCWAATCRTAAGQPARHLHHDCRRADVRAAGARSPSSPPSASSCSAARC